MSDLGPTFLDGELTEARFAASLEEVVSGTAPEAYGGDPTAFFASTYVWRAKVAAQ